jgi:hypothetical protein
MHEIEPYYNWLKYYNPAEDTRSLYFGKEYNFEVYSENIYGYYIDPAWDNIGSETLYIKILYADYVHNYMVMELIGEWNDTINNDIMHLKRNIIDHFYGEGINKFILIGENVFNFHGSDDAYYEEWFDQVEDADVSEGNGWISFINFPDFIIEELRKYNIDQYVNMAGSLQIENWRTLHPKHFYDLVSSLTQKRLGLPE